MAPFSSLKLQLQINQDCRLIGLKWPETFLKQLSLLFSLFWSAYFVHGIQCFCGAEAAADSRVTFQNESLQNNWIHLSFFLRHWEKYDSWVSEMLYLKKYIGTKHFCLKSPPSLLPFLFKSYKSNSLHLDSPNILS